MEFEYKCPVCRANNTLTPTKQSCRRCGSNLSLIYKAKKKKVYRVLKAIIARSAKNQSRQIG